MHRKQLRELAARVQQEGMTLIPVRMYFDKHGRAKLALGVARGKKNYDKRQSIAQRDANRRIERALKQRV